MGLCMELPNFAINSFCVNDFSSEIFYKTARSGGSGGQNVNKVETQAEALWDVAASRFFVPEEKELIQEKLKSKINKDGLLAVKCSETRSQLENKQIAQQKMAAMVAKSLLKPKKRKATKPSKAAKERRLEGKKKEGLKKEMRRPPGMDGG
jgi:ribosome-associated protein